MNNPFPHGRLGLVLVASLVISGALSGCATLVVGAATQSAMLAVDRRSTGAQVDDQTIELRAVGTVANLLGDKGNVSVTSYNRVALLTGEVPTEADRRAVETAVAKIENVRAVVNELAVMPNSSFTQQSNDALITGKVKAGFFDAKELQFASIKVVTERGVVYLMGRVTEAEAAQASNVARSTSGVQKVVKVFEIITAAELAAMPFPPAGVAAPQPAASAPGK